PCSTRSRRARTTGSGDAKSMSATQSGITPSPYFRHLKLSVCRRSITRSKSKLMALHVIMLAQKGGVTCESGSSERARSGAWWAGALAVRHLREPGGVVVDFQNGLNDERVAAIAGRARTLGCVITIGAGLYEPGHATRTDTGKVGFKVGELDGQETARARELAR